MRLNQDWLSRLARGMFALLMAILWAGVTNVRAQPTTKPAGRSAEDRAQLVEQLSRGLRAIEDSEKTLARDTFDVQAVAKANGRDAAKHFEWVRDRTIWVPYRGSLRGGVGVLMDRMGNSLDRAILLDGLLKASGHTTRLAHADLTDTQATELLPKLRTGLPASADRDAVAAAPSLHDVATKYGLDPQRTQVTAERLRMDQQKLLQKAAERVSAQVEALQPLLVQGERTADPSVLVALRDHWWVQRQDGANWIDLDPLLPDAAAGSAVTKATTTVDADKLPDDQHQIIELRVVAEQWQGGKTSETVLLRQALKPSAVSGQTLLLMQMPLDLNTPVDFFAPGLPQRVRETALKQHEWAPALKIGKDMIVQSSISDVGVANPKPVLDSTKRTGRGAEGAGHVATDLLNAGEPAAAKPDSHFTAEWIEYEIRIPGQAPQSIRRQVFDLIGPAARAKGPPALPAMDEAAKLRRALAMSSISEVVISGCQISPQFQSHQVQAAVLANRDVLQKVLTADPTDTKAARDAVEKLQPLPSELLQVALLRGQISPAGGHVFYDQPFIAQRHCGFRTTADNQLTVLDAFDLVNNRMGVHRWSDADPATLRMAQGVADTNAEALASHAIGPRSNAAEDIATADAAGNDCVVIRTLDDPDVAKLALDADTQARLGQDLAAGYVAYCAPPTKGRPATWYRVDPKTGATLGMGMNGWGASLGEYALQVWLISFAASFFICMVATTGAAAAYGQQTVTGSNGTDVSICVGSALIAASAATIAVLIIFVARPSDEVSPMAVSPHQDSSRRVAWRPSASQAEKAPAPKAGGLPARVANRVPAPDAATVSGVVGVLAVIDALLPDGNANPAR